MKKILFILIILILASLVYAQEEAAKYNFGSMQSAKVLSMAPGETVETKLYFYNIYGNRITHISLEVGEAPENWDVLIDPPIHETTVSVSGVPTIITESLYIKPSEAVEEIPEDVPQGIEYILSSVGYLASKPVTIKIKVPADEKLGKVAKVVIDATASWVGQTGTVALTQARSFDYAITVTSKEFTETILEKAPERKDEVVIIKKTEEKVEEEKPTAPQVVEKEVGVSTGIFVGVVVALLIIIIGMLMFFVKGKKKKEKK